MDDSHRTGVPARSIALIVIVAVVLAGFFVGFRVGDCTLADAKKTDKTDKASTEFIKGYNAGTSFCVNPKKKCHKSYRAGVQKMHERFGPWCWKYSKTTYVACLSRIWLESRGNPWSHTKDELLQEAGLTSVSLDTAQRLKEIGHGGDPCGDPEWAVAANAWRGLKQREAMLEASCPDDAKLPCWSDWLPDQWQDNRIEAEYFMSACGGTNCWKVRKAVAFANKEADILDRVGKDGKMHAWWYMVNWLADQNEGDLAILFDPLRISMWRFGTRWGRVLAQWKMRSEFFEPLGYTEDGKPKPNYCWGDEPYYFPLAPVVLDDGITQSVATYELDFPAALFPHPKKGQWRKRCVPYYKKKAWKKSWVDTEPKPNDKWKTGGFKYHPLTGEPITVKKGQRKYPTTFDYAASHAKWIDEMQEQRLLPSDEEYASWKDEMVAEGCAFQYVITSN